MYKSNRLYTLASMKSLHQLRTWDARDLSWIDDESVHLVLTSPPYPMVEMWDEDFIEIDSAIHVDLAEGKGIQAFRRMHERLEPVWKECFRVLAPGGMLCINIGDATRSVNGSFQLYSNHAKIISAAESLGFQTLPLILWRKQTNSPTKFMGSGMMPPGAYVTLEHEYILIFRKGDKREFKTEHEKERRRRSALFWEERNLWFSDVWDFKGVRQRLNGAEELSRGRSAAFPFELAYRLVHMFSLQGDTVLDPFNGTGTTILAAMAGARNSIGIDIRADFTDIAAKRAQASMDRLNAYTRTRVDRHRDFVGRREAEEGRLKHRNGFYDMAVVTAQEKKIAVPLIDDLQPVETGFEVSHVFR